MIRKTPLKKYSKKALEKRKEERKNYPEFYQKHIQLIKQNNICCEECGERLKGDASEVCHIFPKSSFPSVSCEDLNILYLCGMYSSNQCHANFDNFPAEKVQKLFVINKINSIFAELENKVEEKINYKYYDRYSCQH